MIRKASLLLFFGFTLHFVLGCSSMTGGDKNCDCQSPSPSQNSGTNVDDDDEGSPAEETAGTEGKSKKQSSEQKKGSQSQREDSEGGEEKKKKTVEPGLVQELDTDIEDLEILSVWASLGGDDDDMLIKLAGYTYSEAELNDESACLDVKPDNTAKKPFIFTIKVLAQTDGNLENGMPVKDEYTLVTLEELADTGVWGTLGGTIQVGELTGSMVFLSKPTAVGEEFEIELDLTSEEHSLKGVFTGPVVACRHD